VAIILHEKAQIIAADDGNALLQSMPNAFCSTRWLQVKD